MLGEIDTMNINEYPIFSYFLGIYIFNGSGVNYKDAIQEFILLEKPKMINQLLIEIKLIEQEDIVDIQTFFKREFGAKAKQKMIVSMIETIDNELIEYTSNIWKG